MAIAFDVDSSLPVAVVGAGPVGLAAAAHLLAQGEEPIIVEAGPSAGANVLAWGHVRLFSPWRYVVDAAARELLTAAGDGLNRAPISIPLAVSSLRAVWSHWRLCPRSAPGFVSSPA